MRGIRTLVSLSKLCLVPARETKNKDPKIRESPMDQAKTHEFRKWALAMQHTESKPKLRSYLFMRLCPLTKGLVILTMISC